MNRLFCLSVVVLVLLLSGRMPAGADDGKAERQAVAVVPRPMKMEVGEGTFTLGPATTILVSADARQEGEYLAGLLAPATGLKLTVKDYLPGQDESNCIVLRAGLKNDPLGDEGYRLLVRADRVLVDAPTPAGVFHACQTMRQLLPAAVESQAKVDGVPWAIPVVTIEDQPRFSWRGLMLDVGRVYYYKDWLKRTIDLMALYKMNRLHLHLTERTGWRLEVKKYPNFVARQTGVPDPRDPDGKRTMNQFYTQADLREIVAYASSRHVTVVPEIEMPGHFGAHYPEKMVCVRADGKWSRKANAVHGRIMCAGSEGTFEIIDGVLTEVADLFPSPWIHVGGDEAHTNVWAECTRCQARMKAEKLNGEHDLFNYFVKRVEKIVVSKNKRMMGWEEVAAAPGATLQSWHGIEPGIAGARRGQDCVMSPAAYCYLDSSPARCDTQRVYSFEPVPADLPADKVKHVLGVEGPMWMDAWRNWAQYQPKPGTLERVDSQVFPRLIALSEVGWSAADAKDWENFRTRLNKHGQRLQKLGVNFHRDPGVWSK